jgi:hypothetical protein
LGIAAAMLSPGGGDAPHPLKFSRRVQNKTELKQIKLELKFNLPNTLEDCLQ